MKRKKAAVKNLILIEKHSLVDRKRKGEKNAQSIYFNFYFIIIFSEM